MIEKKWKKEVQRAKIRILKFHGHICKDRMLRGQNIIWTKSRGPGAK
jgi:hypothetical protein